MTARGLAAIERGGQSVFLADTALGAIRGPRSSHDVLSALYRGPTGIAWTWGLNPTVNTWLSDIPEAERVAICTAQRTTWNEWAITYIPGHHLRFGTVRGIKAKDALTWVGDLSGFWPGARDLASEAHRWGLDVPGIIARGDAARRWEYPGWTDDDLAEYATARSVLIGQFATHALRRLGEHDLCGERPLAVGSLGSHILHRANGKRWVAKYRPTRQPICAGQSMLDLMFRAYYGGRIESMLLGSWHQPIWRLDLRSAYLWALSWVGPVGFEWEHTTTWTDRLEDRMSLWRVSWSTRDTWVGPFPIRETSEDTDLIYYSEGTGWYWWPEVRAALRAWGDQITVHEGYISPRSSHRPLLEEAQRLYRMRCGLEAARDPLVDMVKGAGNAVYGKLTQRLTYGGDVGQWYNVALSGWICSAVRARLLDLIGNPSEADRHVAAIMTDGILTTQEPTQAPGHRLGDWKLERFERLEQVKSGLYRLIRADGYVSEARTQISSPLDWEWFLDELTEHNQATVHGRLFVPHILADAFPADYGPDRCRWIDNATRIDPWVIMRKRDNVARLLNLKWHEQVAYAGVRHPREPGRMSAPYPYPPAWSATGYDPLLEAVDQAIQAG